MIMNSNQLDTQNLVWSPSRAGLDSTRIQFPGFPARDIQTHVIHPGSSQRLSITKGDIVKFSIAEGASPAVLCIHDNKLVSMTVLGFGNDFKTTLLNASRLSVDDLLRIASCGINLEGGRFETLPGGSDDLIFKSKTSAVMLVYNWVEPDQLIEGGSSGCIEIQLNQDTPATVKLPDPLGEIRDEFTILKGSARAYELKKDEYVQVIDVEGRQCSDFMAMNSQALDKGLERYIDSTITRSLMGGAYPAPGLFDKFFDQDMNPMLALIQDTVGRHDTFALACTARGYEDRGFFGHLNCSDNISEAYQPYGIRSRRAWPAINFFFNSWIHPDDNRIQSDEAWSRPGDYVLMRALTDLVCVSTACPDDVDPINGWNPTDIHVRIYRSNMETKRAIAYRATPEAAAVLTQESPLHARTSKLTRHFSVARDFWMPEVFDATGTIEEYWACHQKATIQDMSNLRKLDITGPDAERLLQLAVSRDVGKLAVNRGFYALMLDERGHVNDDGTLFRLAPDVFRWCCGSDDSYLQLSKLAEEHELTTWIKDISNSLCSFAVQGPASRDILDNVVFTRSAQPKFNNIKWFGFAIARLNNRAGRPFMVARSGYTGQLGYEIFCDRSDAIEIWDAVVASGQEFGLLPQGGQALNMLRVEAGLMASGTEFPDGIDADEAGLGFAIDLRKSEFVGKSAIERNRLAPRNKLVGLVFDGDEVPVHGDGVFVDRRQVGLITSAIRSPELSRVIAMARVSVENCVTGEKLAVGKLDGHMKRLPCEITGIPFIDPKREKPRS